MRPSEGAGREVDGVDKGAACRVSVAGQNGQSARLGTEDSDEGMTVLLHAVS